MKYIFSKKAFAQAKEALLKFQTDGIVFLDEAGPLELKGEGYADCLDTLLSSSIAKLYVAVRSECVDEFKSIFIKGNPIGIIQVK